MLFLQEPSKSNQYLSEHIQLLCDSLRLLTGRELIPPEQAGSDAAKFLYFAPFVVVSHDNSRDPLFNYGNRVALDLFEMSWAEFTQLPSRKSAEPPNREMRSQLLQEVATKGYIDHYAGIRISKSGKRFWIEDVTVWNLVDEQGSYQGQAATYGQWKFIESES
jgi:MEKHLA domain